MEKFIPEYVEPYRLAEQNLRLDGLVKLVDMHRLNTSLMNTCENDTVTVSLQFGMDEQRLPYIKGHLKVVLGLQCQRCLERFNYEIMSDFALGIVKSLDEEKALPEQYEPAMVQDGQLALRELIEDELILNLPIIPRHEPEVCSVKLPHIDSGWKQEDDKENPFKVLQSLKHKEK